MKTLLIFTLLSPTLLMAQSNVVNAETQKINTLMEAAANQKAPSQATQNYVNPFTKSGPASTNLNLTDEQRALSQNYVDQNKANAIIQNNCAGNEMSDVCNGSAPTNSRATLIAAISKSYALFGMMGGGDLLALEKKDPKEDLKDYCKVIPVATEALSTFQEQMNAKAANVPVGGDTAQKQTFLMAAKAHSDRAKSAQIQSTGWYAGAACYTATVAYGNAAWNPAIIIKIGAGLFLGNFYQGEVSRYNGYADKTRALADALPGKGDCNPITENACFCAQPGNDNNTQYCKNALGNRKVPDTSVRVSCVDNQLHPDPACLCQKSNSCFDKVLSSIPGASNLGLGTSGNGPLQGLSALVNGQMTSGTLSGTTANQLKAISNQFLQNNKISGNGDLNKSQKEMAKLLQENGLPGAMAALLSGTNVPANIQNEASAKFASLQNINPIRPTSPMAGVNNHAIDFSGGNSLGIKGNKAVKNDIPNFALKKEGPSSNKLVEFAVQKAQGQSQINKTDSSIFDVISNRYQSSAKKHLELNND